MITTQFAIRGMHCHSCKALIEEVCKEFPSVASCDVDIAREVATVTHDGSLDPVALRREIEKLGTYKTEDIV